MTNRQICEAVGIPLAKREGDETRQAAQCLRKMKAKGLVEREGNRWHAVKGKWPPKCGWGHAPASLAALREHARANAIRMHTRKGRHIKPIATTALEQAWGWLPDTCQGLQPRKACVEIMGGTVRPQETEAA